MTDSFLAPADLGSARRRLAAVARAHCRKLGLEDRLDQRAVVELTGRPFAAQQHLVTAETACVMADMVLWRWDADTLAALADRLGPDAALLFLEPTADIGWRQAAHRLARPLWRLALRHDFETDVPVSLRTAGLTVSTADRFGLGPAGIRSYVWGLAEHITPIERP
ncbi:MAG: hypothetical protein ACR2QO_08425 [Acidimicrobiales bacterium]